LRGEAGAAGRGEQSPKQSELVAGRLGVGGLDDNPAIVCRAVLGDDGGAIAQPLEPAKSGDRGLDRVDLGPQLRRRILSAESVESRRGQVTD
jgi:hypothetical protein